MERLFRKLLEIAPTDANYTGNFANFLAGVRKNYDEAERLYRRALELDPGNANHTGNFAAFCLSVKRWEEAEKLARQAYEMGSDAPKQARAEAALYLSILLRRRGENDSKPLETLKALLCSDFPRAFWSFDTVFAAISGEFSKEDFAFYQALGAAVLDPEQIAALEEYSQWRSLENGAC